MSRFTPTYRELPLRLPPCDLSAHLQNYYLLRSFQKNWSASGLRHIPAYRPASGIVAGDHYFEWTIPTLPFPVLTVTFICCPAVTTSLPICYSNLSPRYPLCLDVYLLSSSVQPFLPDSVVEDIYWHGSEFDFDFDKFVQFLEHFIDNFHHPPSPLPSPTRSPPLCYPNFPVIEPTSPPEH